MADLPSNIKFTCEACSASFKPAKVRKLAAHCSKCGAKSWSMSASYIDYEQKRSVTGTASLMVFGIGWSNTKTHCNSYEVGGLDQEIVSWMTEEKAEVEIRVGEFIRKAQIEKHKEEGRLNCSQCNLLFQPVDHKAWTKAGFCSSSCAMHGGHSVSQAEIKRLTGGTAVDTESTVNLTCPNGHEFPVMRSFTGCKRPCPICNEKCLVP